VSAARPPVAAAVPPAPPLTVWRLTSSRWAARAFDGEGARLHGGRWNHAPTSLVYTSLTLSLAALEMLVHVDGDTAPADLVAVSAHLPAGLAVEHLAPTALPAGWRAFPAPEACRDLGSAWAAAGSAPALAVPSVVVPREWNLLLNPRHPDLARIEIGTPEPFSFDPRLWK
jgi:RES domain-containing protein